MNEHRNNERFNKGDLIRIKKLTRCYLNYSINNDIDFDYIRNEIKLEESTILRFISYDNNSRLFIPKVQPFFAEVVSDRVSHNEGNIVYLVDMYIEGYSVHRRLTFKSLPLI